MSPMVSPTPGLGVSLPPVSMSPRIPASLPVRPVSRYTNYQFLYHQYGRIRA